MKRMTQILSLGLLLSISSVALAERGNDRNNYGGNYGGQHYNSYQYDRHDNYRNYRDGRRQYSRHDRYGRRHYVNNNRYAPRHLHQGRYCYDWHPYGYVAPRVRYGYSVPGLVIGIRPNVGIYIGDGR